MRPSPADYAKLCPGAEVLLKSLPFLHKQFLRGRILFRSARSINRLRRAVNRFVGPFGNLSSARHAVRFNLIGKDCNTKSIVLSFALETIRSFDTSRSLATRNAVLQNAWRLKSTLALSLANLSEELVAGQRSLMKPPCLVPLNAKLTAGVLSI